LPATAREEMFKCRQKHRKLTINPIRKTKHISHQISFLTSLFRKEAKKEESPEVLKRQKEQGGKEEEAEKRGIERSA